MTLTETDVKLSQLVWFDCTYTERIEINWRKDLSAFEIVSDLNVWQLTIRKCFAASTCLTIAHRLETIMDSDRILVMGDGVIKEQVSAHRRISLAVACASN